MFKNVQEITDYFVKNGWSKGIRFKELTLVEAEEFGNDYIISKIKLGKKFFKMDITGNIFNDQGKLVVFGIKCC